MRSTSKLIPVAAHTFRLEPKTGNGDLRGELAIFELDEQGQVLRLKVGENYTFPQVEW